MKQWQRMAKVSSFHGRLSHKIKNIGHVEMGNGEFRHELRQPRRKRSRWQSCLLRIWDTVQCSPKRYPRQLRSLAHESCVHFVDFLRLSQLFGSCLVFLRLLSFGLDIHRRTTTPSRVFPPHAAVDERRTKTADGPADGVNLIGRSNRMPRSKGL